MTNVFAWLFCLISWRDDFLKLGAYDQDKLVSLLIADRRYGRIDYLLTSKKYRGWGIGRMLVELSGCDVVSSSVWGRGYWERLGFVKPVMHAWGVIYLVKQK